MVKLWRMLRQDMDGLVDRVRPIKSWRAPRGMHTFRLGGVHEAYGQRRLHLRIGEAGDGALFVDVTDVIHLNATAATIAWWALTAVPRDEARRRLMRGRTRQARDAVDRDIDALYTMVARLHDPSTGCPTCAISDTNDASKRPLFSTPIDAPYKVDLALTYDCNNDCPHCYNEPDRLEMPPLPGAQWERIIDRLIDVGVPHMIFTGGEATLHPDLPRLIAHADGKGAVCGLNSNGRRLVHKPYADELKAAGLNHVQITLGSHDAGVHNQMMNARAFEQTVRGIRQSIDSGLHTITNTTLLRMNAGEIEQTIDFIHELGIRTFAVNGVIYTGGGESTGQAIAEDELAPILVRIRDHAKERDMRFLWYTPTEYCRLSPVELEIGAKRCNAGEYSMCVEPNGDVLPCQSFYTAAGNMLRDPWEQIWRSDLFRSFRERGDDPQGHGLPEKCWDCPDMPLCGGGCRIEREAREGGGSDDGCCGGGCGSGACGSHQLSADLLTSAPVDLTVGGRRRSTGDFVKASK